MTNTLPQPKRKAVAIRPQTEDDKLIAAFLRKKRNVRFQLENKMMFELHGINPRTPDSMDSTHMHVSLEDQDVFSRNSRPWFSMILPMSADLETEMGEAISHFLLAWEQATKKVGTP